MAKSTPKPAAKSPKKKAPEKKASATKKSHPVELIVTACEVSLSKLNELDIEYDLQSEINWCLGSFRNDMNPVGLYQMADRSLQVFKIELAKKTKGITPKLIKDLEKAIQGA
jgi:hypothetical protein